MKYGAASYFGYHEKNKPIVLHDQVHVHVGLLQ